MALFTNITKGLLGVGSFIALITSIIQLSDLNKLSPLELQGILSSSTFIVCGMLIMISLFLIESTLLKASPFIIAFGGLLYFTYTIYKHYSFMIEGNLASSTNTFLAICVAINSLIGMYMVYRIKSLTETTPLTTTLFNLLVFSIIIGVYGYLVYRMEIMMTDFVTDG